MDLTPLITDPDLDPADYTTSFIRRFESDVRTALQNLF